MRSHATLAIDFGTSNSLVGSVCDGEKNFALPIDDSSVDPTVMRSLLYFPEPDVCFYGQKAVDEFLNNDMEGRLFRSFKAHLPNQNYLGTVFNSRVLSLENIIGLFLLELKKRAEVILGQKISRAVIGRPARYAMDDVSDGFALHRMQKACQFAGFDHVQFIPEPLAAAFDYRRTATEDKTILIGDFGGGTSDFTIMKIHSKKFDSKDVLSIDGCAFAGDALDSLFMAKKLNEYFGATTKYKMPLSNNVLTMPPSIMMRLNHPAHIVHLKEKDTYEFVKEVRKCALTQNDAVQIDRLFAMIEDNQIFPFFENIEACKKELSSHSNSKFKFEYPDIDVHETFFSDQFVTWAQDVKNNIFAALDRVLANAGLSEAEIDLVCLTGGTSKVPLIQNEFTKRFGAEKIQTQAEFHSVTRGLVEIAALSELKII